LGEAREEKKTQLNAKGKPQRKIKTNIWIPNEKRGAINYGSREERSAKEHRPAVTARIIVWAGGMRRGSLGLGIPSPRRTIVLSVNRQAQGTLEYGKAREMIPRWGEILRRGTPVRTTTDLESRTPVKLTS